MGYPQLLHLYPPEEILVGPGIAPEEVEEIFVEACPGRRTGCIPLKTLSCPGLRARPPDTVPQNERLAACGERREAHPPASTRGTPPLYEASGSNSRIRVARMVSTCAASSGWTWHTQRFSTSTSRRSASMAARWSRLSVSTASPARTISCCKSRNCSALCASAMAFSPCHQLCEAARAALGSPLLCSLP